MSRAKTDSRRLVAAEPASVDRPVWPAWLSAGAFVLAAALVFARATMLETLRNPLDVQPGAEAVPRGPGAGTGLVLDLLCCVPAVLVLARRALDPAFSLRFAWGFVPLALLAAWTPASALWAGDRFAALVAGVHWTCAGVLLWSVAQLVRTWADLRLVVALSVGLLLVQAGQGLYYRFVEHPDLVEQWNAQREQIIRQRGWEPGSFIANQFEKRVLSGEMMGFTSSPNSFGAVLVLLTLAAAGGAVQRLTDRDGAAWAAAPAAAAGLGLLVIVFLNSRTAMATPVLGAALLAGAWAFRGVLARHARLAYALGVCGFAAGAGAVIGHGIHHGTLFADSLTFRWRYWVAAWKLFLLHPAVGVGWENFGPHYLAVRLPVAAEEIKDPHNLFVRFATELGVIGLLLAVAWLLLLWWDLTQLPSPVGEGDDSASAPAASGERGAGAAGPLAAIAAVGVLGTAINLVASIDWAQSGAYNAIEVLRRLGLLCLFGVGAALTALRSADDPAADDRPARWARVALLVGLGLFLLHNLVDFSLFEPGPMFLFAFTCGAAIGIAGVGVAPRPRRAAGGLARAAVAVAVVLWLTGAVFAARVVTAEEEAAAGDEALRTLATRSASLHFGRAAELVPYNADYAFRAARAHLSDPRGDAAAAATLLTEAIRRDPIRPQYWLHRAYARLRMPSPDAAGARADYAQALRLDPNNVEVRLEFAEVLRRLGDGAAALEQFREALRYNDLLPPDEVKRLPPQRVGEVKRAVGELAG